MKLHAHGLSTLFVIYGDELRRHVAKKLGCAEDIEDLVQEVFLRAHRALSKRRIEQPRAYLHRIASSAIADHFRRGSRRGSPPLDITAIDDDSDLLSNMPTPEDFAICEQTWSSLIEAIECLPPQARRAIVQHKLEEQSRLEVARSMGISIRTLEKHLARGMTNLRATLLMDSP
jgi:RNA polymerase sigma factor (sigma-70 family)